MNPTRPTALLLLGLLAAGCSDFATAPDRTPTDVRITPDSVTLLEGETISFRVEVLDGDGVPYERIPSWSPPAWSSSAPELVSVDDAGVGTGRAVGEGRVRVQVAGLPTSALVRTNPRSIGVDVAFVHLTQSVQRTGGDVPLIAGRDGLLRVYVRGSGLNFFRPAVRATFQIDGEAIHAQTLTLESPGLPVEVERGDLALSYDGVIPGSVFRPGVALVVEVDPDGTVPSTDGSELRVPATGALELTVREVLPFRLRIVPVHQSSSGRPSRLTAKAVTEVTRRTEAIFPFGTFDVDMREPYTTEARLESDDGWYQLIEEIAVLRWDDGSERYYYGGFDRAPGPGIQGLGYLGYPVAIGREEDADVVAHEVGHTLSLPHAPCGGPAFPDPEYPYANGVVGQWGYDREADELQDPALRYDLMTYCDPVWISDYNYEKVIAYRDTSAYAAGSVGDDPRTPASADGERVLLVRGGVLDGRLRLEPALEWTGPVALPDREGRYTLEGLDRQGRAVFTLALEPRPLDHAAGGAQFLVAVPVRWADGSLERLRLTGPEGVVERARSPGPAAAAPQVRVEPVAPGRFAAASAAARWDATRYPLAVVRDRRTGSIRAMSRTGEVAIPGADPDRFAILLSDGVATRAARVVRP
jgi:hypothetical protein